MRSDSEIIKSYLVSLGADVDLGSFAKMDKALGISESRLATYQIAATSALGGAAASVAGYISHLANLDQQQQITAMRFGLSVPQYRAVDSALKVMGKSMDEIFWGTDQMRRQFRELYQDQQQMNAMLGPDYEKQMEQVREINFQMQRLELRLQNFGMLASHDFLKKLGFGDDGITKQLDRLNSFITEHMPEWADELSTDFLPVWNEIWEVLKGTGHEVYLLGNLFTNLIGIITGDQSLEGETTNFHQFAKAVADVVGWVGQLLNLMLLAEGAVTHFGGAVGHGIRSLADNVRGDHAGALREDELAQQSARGIMDDFKRANERALSIQNGFATGKIQDTPANSIGSFLDASAAQKAMAVAQKVSKDTGIPANILFGQMGFETGGFTNRGARTLNNFAGIQVPGSSAYKSFDSVDDFAKYYESTLTNKRYTNRGILAARTPEAFARALRGDGSHDVYFAGDKRLSNEQNIANYAAGIKKYGDIKVEVQVGSVNSSSPEQVAAAAKRGTEMALAEHDQRQMAELNGAYR